MKWVNFCSPPPAVLVVAGRLLSSLLRIHEVGIGDSLCIIPAADWCTQARRLALIIRRRRKYLGGEEENIYLCDAAARNPPKNGPVFVQKTDLWPLLHHLTAMRHFWNVAKTQLRKWRLTVDVVRFKFHVRLFTSSSRFLCLASSVSSLMFATWLSDAPLFGFTCRSLSVFPLQFREVDLFYAPPPTMWV